MTIVDTAHLSDDNNILTSHIEDNIFWSQVPEADAGDRGDLRQQADLHLEDRRAGPGDPAQSHPVTSILHHYQGSFFIR